MKSDKAIKIIACTCFVLIAVAVLLIRGSPATGYEPSIYRATPPLAWGFLLFSIVCGISIIVHQVWAKKEGNLWTIGLILIILSNTVILSLHILRGYALWSVGDSATHLGYINEIIATGHTWSGNFYPITHIYLAQLSQLWNVDPLVLHKWVPVFLTLIYVLFMYFLAKSLLPHKRQVIIATVAATALTHGWYLNLTPNHLSNLAFPLAFYLLVRSLYPGTLQWKILFLIIVFLFPTFHPLPAFALFLILVTLWLPRRILTSLTKDPRGVVSTGFQFNATAVSLLFVWTIIWISSSYIWESTIWNLRTLITEGGQTRLSMLMVDISRASAYGYSVTEQFFKVYSSILVFVILALVALPILWRRIATNNGKLARLAALYGPLAIFAPAIVVFYFFNLYFSPFRLLMYPIIMCTILAGFTLFEFMRWGGSHGGWLAKTAPLLIAVLLVGISVNGILKVYPSPYLLEGNWQVTQTQIEGMDWYFHNKSTTLSTTGITIPPGRFADLLLTPEEKAKQQNVPFEMTADFIAPYHFGYDKTPTLGGSYTEDTYLLLNATDRSWYVDIFPRMAELRWQPEDYERLENDSSVDKMYCNGGLDIYYIHALVPST